MAVTLYDLAAADAACRFSPYCWRTRMALAHKGLVVETVPWRFTDKPMIAASGQDRVPVIDDGGTVVHDSTRIAAYLDETYPDRPPLIAGPDAAGLTVFLRGWTDRVLHPHILKAVLPDLFERLHEKDKPYFRETREQRFGTTLEGFAGDRAAAIAALRQALAPLAATLEAQPFLCGDAPAYGDYVVFGAMQWARTTSPIEILPPDSPIAAWRGRLLDLFDGLAAATPAAA